MKRTRLHDNHTRLNGRMIEFFGWEMPVEYSGIMDEHLAVRGQAGLFDVSHMGEILVSGPQALDFVQHLTPNNACLSFTCTGAFSIGVPDSGIGFSGAWHVNDRFKILGGVNDANADRYDFGDIGEGEFFKVIDFNVKIWPVTEKAGYSRFTLWQVDENGGSNGALGPKGWGYHILLEQELSSDGSLVGIAKYGRSMKGSAFYRRQGVLALVKYEPDWFTGINNDSVGASFSVMKAWIDNTQTEKNLEFWYKFPLTPKLQTSLHYQGIFNPSLRFDKDYASAWSIRFTTAF